MAFFNLTALGPEKFFEQKETFIHLFSRKDLETSFEKIVTTNKTIQKGEIGIESIMIDFIY